MARNLRLGALELDIVARNGPLVVIVEVRTRGPRALVGAFGSITKVKRDHLLRATNRLWQTTLSTIAGVNRVRIDVAAVTFRGGKTSVAYAKGAIVG